MKVRSFGVSLTVFTMSSTAIVAFATSWASVSSRKELTWIGDRLSIRICLA